MKKDLVSALRDERLRQFAGYNLKRAYLMIREAVVETLAPFGLRPTSFSALVIICDNPDLTQSRLAEALNIKRSGVVLIVDELEQLNLISRNQVPDDRRSYALRASLRGIKLCDEACAAVDACENALLSNLTGDECRLLKNLFQFKSRYV